MRKSAVSLLALVVVVIGYMGSTARCASVPYNELANETAIETQTEFKIGDRTLVYLHFRSNATGLGWEYWHGKYFPKVDEFSRMDLLNTSWAINDTSAEMWVDYGNYTTRHRLFSMGDRFVPSWSIVLTYKKGKPQGIAFDGDCDQCIGTWCLNETCTMESSQKNCNMNDTSALKDDPGRCGVKVFLAFDGDDKEGTPMTSTSSLPSRFQRWSVAGALYESVSGFWNDFFPW
ncbi:hypothetical protein Pelo_11203 [Pelomyxa schiedti]|nr:hypothetical protein Pelo_11203 [Pelomyxa schiedti]